MKKLILVLVVLFAFTMNVNAQDIASNDANENSKEFGEINNPKTSRSDKLLKIAKDYLKSIGDDDYKIIKFYNIDEHTTPVFRQDGITPFTFYVYLEREGKIIVAEYYRADYGDEKESIEIVGVHKGPLKKQIPFR